MRQILTVTSAGTVIANRMGARDTVLAVLIIFMAADYVTGLAVALVFHASRKTEGDGLASGECFKGLVRKCMVLVFIWLGTMLDSVIGGTYVRTVIILFYIGNEELSIIENTAYMDVPYPAFVKNALEAMRDKGNSGGAGYSDTSPKDGERDAWMNRPTTVN